MDWLWQRINAEIERRGKSWAWLGRQIGAKAQTMTNWRLRVIPPARHAAIARALDWTLDDMLNEDWTPEQHPPAGRWRAG